MRKEGEQIPRLLAEAHFLAADEYTIYSAIQHRHAPHRCDLARLYLIPWACEVNRSMNCPTQSLAQRSHDGQSLSSFLFDITLPQPSAQQSLLS